MRRKAVEEATHRKIMSITAFQAGLWANTNLDADENRGMRDRMMSEYTENMEESFNIILAKIYGADSPDSIDEVDMDDPFFSAMKLPYVDPDLGNEVAAPDGV